MEAIENLKSVLCDPDGKCCTSGSTEDRRIVDAALEALQAENARLTKECDSFEVANIAVAFERDKALARLAEIEAQESVATVLLHEGEKIIDGTMAFMDTAWLGMPLFASAGASPVEPSESVEHRDELAKRKPEPAAETVGGLAKAVKAARGGDAPPAPMRRFA